MRLLPEVKSAHGLCNYQEIREASMSDRGAKANGIQP